MKPIYKLYLITFLATGITYGLLMSLIEWADGSRLSGWQIIYRTSYFGLAMSLIIVSYHKYRLKKIGIRELTEENLGVSHNKILKSKLNIMELIEELKKDPIFGKMKISEKESEILIRSNLTWESWGEEIKIILNKHIADEYEYQVSSRPKFSLTLVDYGKNLENMMRIESVLINMV
ncbi:MAG: hypothetical protein IPH93_07245 [Saprospiraceae bacterium]|nr:hypothetical protein [Saprospiraceae bacterium]MBK9630731.1 hypothetical protein [Saprospiraceae bacterium]